MRNKLLITLFIGIVVLGVTGCNKKKETAKVKVEGPRVVCTSSDKTDGIKTEGTVTLKFNSDNYVSYEVIESVSTFDSKKTFDIYVDSVKESADDISSDDVEYSYSVDKKNKKLSTTMIYKESLFDYSQVTEEEKANYLASKMIKAAEDSGSTCKFIEITKKDLGIE